MITHTQGKCGPQRPPEHDAGNAGQTEVLGCRAGPYPPGTAVRTDRKVDACPPFIAVDGGQQGWYLFPTYPVGRRTTITSAAQPGVEGFRVQVTPYLCTRNAASAIAFYQAAFDAVESFERMVEPDGRVGHAEMRIGDALILLADEHPEIQVLSPTALGGSGVTLVLEVPDVDARTARAIAAGATLQRPAKDEPYGRVAVIIDPFGHRWLIMTPPGTE